MEPTVKSRLLKEYKDPEIFLALNKMCEYLVNEAWHISVLGSGETEAEFNLALSRSKRYEREINILALIDFDLAWGQIKRKTKDGLWVTSGEHDFNPWYEGDLRLDQLLNSLEDFADLISSQHPRYLKESEFLHYYDYLSGKLIKRNASPVSIQTSNLHPLLQEHCLRLFNGGHYSDTILTAYKVIFNEIKRISSIWDLDGKKLVEKAFSLENPLIKLNELKTQSDKDEQQGFMLLYSGAAVGIRNPKAHDLVVQQDKQKTLSYLAFASLLIERLESRTFPAPDSTTPA